jgi:hypothetical protein
LFYFSRSKLTSIQEMLKSQLTCSYCSKIFKDPINLPCEDSICRGHLKERDVAKANRIKCKTCNEDFQIKDNHFESNEALTQLIESHSYLSREEISLKRELEECIRQFFEFFDAFIQNRTKLESDVFDHFQEIRFQIDEQREELKKRIDDIALAMVDQTKKSEEMYLKNIKEHFSSFDESKSLQIKKTEMEEMFRNPNLLIQTIREMQQEQEESLKDIQIKLNEMNQAKEFFMETNTFKPNLSSLNQNETYLFGLIQLSEYSYMNSLKSQILINQQEYFELVKVCEFSSNDSWSLLYRGTRDGFGAKDFHSRCDDHANTLTIFKAKQSKFIFGGYTTVAWDSSSEFKSDPNAFLFSLTNKDNTPVKMKIDPNRHHVAIYCHSRYGPIFGNDICIVNNANTIMDCSSNLGYNYKHPQYEEGTNESKSFLAGSYEFQLDEIEVYQKE